MRKLRRKRVAVASMAVALAAAGSAAAFQQLPGNDQVNNDPTAGINPALGVDGGDPTNADVVGGALVAGKVNVPWAIFRQTRAAATGPDLLALVCGWGMDDARHRDRRRTFKRISDIQRLAQLRPDPGRRGASDRLRRRWSHGAVGDVV